MRLNHGELEYLQSRILHNEKTITRALRNIKKNAAKLESANPTTYTVLSYIKDSIEVVENARRRQSILLELLGVLQVRDEVEGKDSPLEQLGRCAD